MDFEGQAASSSFSANDWWEEWTQGSQQLANKHARAINPDVVTWPQFTAYVLQTVFQSSFAFLTAGGGSWAVADRSEV